MKQHYQDLDMSILSFAAKEGFRGANIKDNGEYPLEFPYGANNISLPLTKAMTKLSVKPVSQLVYERIKETLEPELTQEETYALYLDTVVAEELMRRNYCNKQYKEAINCAQRMIENTEMLEQYDPDTDQETMQMQKQWAQQFQQKSHWAWENPVNNALLVIIDYAQQTGDTETVKELENEFKEYQPKNK
jgi:hypothetical protein